MPFDLPIRDATALRLVYSLLALVVVFALARLGRRLVQHYVENPERRYRLSKYIGRFAGVAAVLLIVTIWSPGLQNIITILTVIGAGLAIVMREMLLSFVGWMYIAFRTPFGQGDRIEMDGVHGDVVDIRLLHTTLMEIGGWVDADQSTGRLVHVPNNAVFQGAIYNYTRGFSFIWNELSLTVTYRSDWRAAREIMTDLAQQNAEDVEQKAARELRRLSREYLVHYNILTPFVYVQPTEKGVQLTLRFLCEARKRRGSVHSLTLRILEAFTEHGDIELAYPLPSIQTYKTPQFGPIPEGERSPQSPPDSSPNTQPPDAG